MTGVPQQRPIAFLEMLLRSRTSGSTSNASGLNASLMIWQAKSHMLSDMAAIIVNAYYRKRSLVATPRSILVLRSQRGASQYGQRRPHCIHTMPRAR